MKKLILVLLLASLPYSLFAKEYEYGLETGEHVHLSFFESAHLGSSFLTETWEESFAQIFFCGIDSNHNIHLLKKSCRYANGLRIVLNDLNLILKYDPQKHIFLDMLLTTAEIVISPINNSYIKIKLLPNKTVKRTEVTNEMILKRTLEANLGALRSAVVIYYGAHEGKWPRSLNELVPEFLDSIPEGDWEYNPETVEVISKSHPNW